MKDRILVIVMTLFLIGYVYETFGSVQISSSNSRSNPNYDEIRTSDGVACRQAMGSNLIAEIGIGQVEEQNVFDEINNNNNSGQVAAFGRLTYAIGAPKRLDCTRIYQMELLKLQEQLRQLQEQ